MTLDPGIYNPRDRATINDPIPVFRALQDDDPCHWCGPLKSWLVTRYEDAREILRDEQISADRLTPYYTALPPDQRGGISDIVRYLNTWVAFKDPPEHTRMRSLLNKVFTPGEIRNLRPAVAQAVAHLLTPLREVEAFDFIEEYAYPLPATVILMMLGLPADDRQRLHQWSTQMQPFIGGATSSPDKYARAQAGAIAMADYFRTAIQDRASRPRDDMLTKLVAARERDDALTEDEIIGTAMLFLFGGHETTTNLIGNGVRALLKHPAELERLRAESDLIKPAVEEVLRYDGPTLATVRVVKQDHERHGREMTAGQRVFVMIHGANHDLRQFRQADTFDITRDPNPHLTFNYGIHFCLGAPLARLEGELAIGAALAAMPTLALTDDNCDYMDTLVMRGAWSMPVRQA